MGIAGGRVVRKQKWCIALSLGAVAGFANILPLNLGMTMMVCGKLLQAAGAVNAGRIDGARRPLERTSEPSDSGRLPAAAQGQFCPVRPDWVAWGIQLVGCRPEADIDNIEFVAGKRTFANAAILDGSNI